jgi:hypothetical protein
MLADMLKCLNILAVAYLAAAPGMDVGRLIHSVNLCRFADPTSHARSCAEAHECSGHSHEPQPEPEKDCPHLHEVAVYAPAMAAAPLQSIVVAALPSLCIPVIGLYAPLYLCHFSDDDPRPPPGPELVGTVVLLV